MAKKAKHSRCNEALACCERLSSDTHKVYFIQSGNFVKIGYTSGSADDRLRDFLPHNPHELVVLAEIPGGMKLEQALHKVFKKDRYRYEWFHFSNDIMEFLFTIQKWCTRYPVRPFDLNRDGLLSVL